MTRLHRLYLYVFVIFAIAYIGTIPLQPYAGSFIVKAVPVLSLSALVLMRVTGLRGKLLFAGLLLSAAGDIMLALGAGQYFIIGLSLFLAAHFVYAVTFSRDFKLRVSRIPIALLLVVYAVAIALVLTPYLGVMAVPVYVYILVITAMGILAVFRASSSMLVVYGALFFIASDSILAVNRFMTALPAADYLVMGTYYLAQFLIAYGFVREEARRKSAPDGGGQ